MKADRTVIVFGVFLFLLGLAVAWNGYGYVQVERGWTLVISGTIAFCTGLILIALGLALRQLAEIAASAGRSVLFLAKAKSNSQSNAGLWAPEALETARVAAPAEPEHRHEPESEPEDVRPPAEVEEAESAPFVAEHAPRGGRAEWAAANWQEPEKSEPEKSESEKLEPEKPDHWPPAESFASKPPVWMTRAGSYVSTYAAARTADTPEVPAKPDADDGADWLEEAIAQEIAVAEEEGPEETGAEAAPHAEDADALEREAAPFGAPRHEEPAPVAEFGFWRAPEAEAAIESEAAAKPEPEPEPIADRPAEPAHYAEHRAASLSEPEPESELAPEPEPEARPPIIGSYEAHGTHYTMYADGSIDAETAHGVYRFASMEELKRFIEKS